MIEQRLEFPPYSLWETRAGSGTPVALIHGLSGSARWFSRNIHALAERHLVAAVDLTGFGRSRRFYVKPEIPPSFEEVTALLARWMETFGAPVHVIGHSMGGLLAIRLAAERPDLIRSLVLVNAAGMPFRFDPRPHVRSLPKPPYGGIGIARVLVPDFFRAGPASVMIAGTRVVMGDLRSMMNAVHTPTLLVWGENDPLVPVTYAEAMQREIPHSQLVVIPRAAHVAMWDAPEEFNREALAFLEEVERNEFVARPRRFSWGIAGWFEGMAHRQAGWHRDIVLVHGLGMSSAYFARLAEALHEAGWNPIAPDLPGFGESLNAPAGGPEEQASQLAAWADAHEVKNAVWLGHSIGCNTVAHVARLRPDLVRQTIHLGPLWTRRRFREIRFFAHLALDALREPLSLYRYVIPAYWRTGVARWWMTWRRFVPDIFGDVPTGVFIAGRRDPLPDRGRVTLIEVSGCHACNVSHAKELAAEITKVLR